MNPSSYCFFLAFGFIIVITSVLCIRNANRQNLTIWFLEHIRKAYYLLLALAVMMIGSLFVSSRVCRIKQNLNSWPIIWSFLCVTESVLLNLHLNWFIRELKDLGFQSEAQMAGVAEEDGEPGTDHRNKSRELPSKPGKQDTSTNGVMDLSMTSITTV